MLWPLLSSLLLKKKTYFLQLRSHLFTILSRLSGFRQYETYHTNVFRAEVVGLYKRKNRKHPFAQEKIKENKISSISTKKKSML